MIYKSESGDINLEKLTRLYPAALIESQGERAEMSLEWIELNSDKVNLLHYVLVFDFTPHGSDKKERIVLKFEQKELLFNTMENVSKLFKN